jgi:hypothetical protein
MFGIELVVVAQELARRKVLCGVDSVPTVSSNADGPQDTVWGTRVINETAEIGFYSRINVPAGLELHNVKIGIVWMILRPGLQALCLGLFVNDFTDILLNEVALLEGFQRNEAPTLALFPLWLAFRRLSKTECSVATL